MSCCPWNAGRMVRNGLLKKYYTFEIMKYGFKWTVCGSHLGCVDDLWLQRVERRKGQFLFRLVYQ